jgi:rhomboid protease GlpG
MRQAGTITTKRDAERFANYLLSLGISSKIEPANGEWAVWIHDENQIPRSKQELEQFQREPEDRRYADAEHAARQARREATEKKRQAERNFIDMRNEWASPWRRRPVTMALIIFSVLVFLGVMPVGDFYISTSRSWTEVENGEVWRLVTPIFLHFGILHILFNMYWLYDLGTMIERRLGSILYLLLILAIAVPSNVGQFVVTGPAFGGMSGVVFGLFGYAWVRGRMEPASGLFVRPDVAFWMFGWFVLCLTGLVGNVANWAHGVGLAVGAVLGYLAYLAKTRRKKT